MWLIVAISNSINSISGVVRNQQRTVSSYQNVSGSAPSSLALKPTLSERLVRDCLTCVAQAYQAYSVTYFFTSVPRSVFRDEDLIDVLFREHLSIVEGHSKRCNVWPQTLNWWLKI